MVLCSSCDGFSLKILYKNLPDLQFNSTDRLSLLSTPLRIRWTVPLSESHTYPPTGETRQALLYLPHQRQRAGRPDLQPLQVSGRSPGLQPL
jgi:hypothetical protein